MDISRTVDIVEKRYGCSFVLIRNGSLLIFQTKQYLEIGNYMIALFIPGGD